MRMQEAALPEPEHRVRVERAPNDMTLGCKSSDNEARERFSHGRSYWHSPHPRPTQSSSLGSSPAGPLALAKTSRQDFTEMALNWAAGCAGVKVGTSRARRQKSGESSHERGARRGDCGPWTSASSPPLANRSFPTQGKIRADVLEKNQAGGARGLDKPWVKHWADSSPTPAGTYLPCSLSLCQSIYPLWFPHFYPVVQRSRDVANLTQFFVPPF